MKQIKYEIRHVTSGFYLSKSDGERGNNNQYMHKNGTVHSYCGEENFFKTKEDAQKVLDKYNKKDKDIPMKQLVTKANQTKLRARIKNATNAVQRAGFVCIGNGDPSNPLSNIIPTAELYCYWNNDGFTNNRYGSWTNTDYYVTEQFYNDNIATKARKTTAKAGEPVVSDIETKLRLASSYVGKQVISPCSGKVERFGILFDGGDVKTVSHNVQEHAKKHGYCVYVAYNGFTNPVENISLGEDFAELKVGDYTAKVYKDHLLIKGEKIPLTKVKEILDAAKTL